MVFILVWQEKTEKVYSSPLKIKLLKRLFDGQRAFRRSVDLGRLKLRGSPRCLPQLAHPDKPERMPEASPVIQGSLPLGSPVFRPATPASQRKPPPMEKATLRSQYNQT